MSKALEYVSTLFSLLGAAMIVVPIPWLAFLLFTIASVFWLLFAWWNRHVGLAVTQFFMLAMNALALYRTLTGAWHG